MASRASRAISKANRCSRTWALVTEREQHLPQPESIQPALRDLSTYRQARYSPYKELLLCQDFFLLFNELTPNIPTPLRRLVHEFVSGALAAVEPFLHPAPEFVSIDKLHGPGVNPGEVTPDFLIPGVLGIRVGGRRFQALASYRRTQMKSRPKGGFVI
jgi:hypothetical protein